jgi:hypothetical protein
MLYALIMLPMPQVPGKEREAKKWRSTASRISNNSYGPELQPLFQESFAQAKKVAMGR